MTDRIIHQAGEVALNFLRAHPVLPWIVAALLTIRVAVVVVRCFYFQRMTMPGVPRWPGFHRWGKAHLIRYTRYLTPWRYFVVVRVSVFGVFLAKLAFVVLLISFIPLAEIARRFPLPIQAGLVAFIIAAVVFDRTRLHRIVGAFLIGATTDVLVLPAHVVVLRFFFFLLPYLRVYRREPELGLTAGLEPHEQSGEEDRSGRPIFVEAFHVVLRIGNRAIRVATVFGKNEATRMAGSFAALSDEQQKQRGIDKRKITHGAWSFGGKRIEHQIPCSRECLNERFKARHGLLVRMKLVACVFTRQHVANGLGGFRRPALGQQIRALVAAFRVTVARAVVLHEREVTHGSKSNPLPFADE